MAEGLVAAVSAALGDEIAEGTPGAAMMAKFGGAERCLKRYVAMSGGTDAEIAATAVRATIAFRTEHGVDDITASSVLAKVGHTPIGTMSRRADAQPRGKPAPLSAPRALRKSCAKIRAISTACTHVPAHLELLRDGPLAAARHSGFRHMLGLHPAV
eukprot:COSAG06_NODE_88_length_24864_cov_7.159368_5_plen_157_part_00